MHALRDQINIDLCDAITGRKSCSQIQSSLNALQNVLTPRQSSGIGFINGSLVAASGHSIQFGPGVVGPSAEYAGYNDAGEFFHAPVSSHIFHGIHYNDGANVVILSKEEAKDTLKRKCESKIKSMPQMKRSVLCAGVSKVKKCLQTLTVYGEYMTNRGTMVDSFHIDDPLFGFIEDVLNEYDEIPSNEKKAYLDQWDVMAHGFDDSPGKWNQKKFTSISQAVKESFESPDLHCAWLCRLIKDAIYCFDNGVDSVNDGHAHYFNMVLDKVDKL